MKRKCFDYKFIEETSFGKETWERFNAYGKDGWELVAVYPITQESSGPNMWVASRLRFFFKRELVS